MSSLRIKVWYDWFMANQSESNLSWSNLESQGKCSSSSLIFIVDGISECTSWSSALNVISIPDWQCVDVNRKCDLNWPWWDCHWEIEEKVSICSTRPLVGIVKEGRSTRWPSYQTIIEKIHLYFEYNSDNEININWSFILSCLHNGLQNVFGIHFTMYWMLL